MQHPATVSSDRALSPPLSLPPELVRCAQKQHGLLLLRQCDEAGVDRRDIRRRVRRGEWRIVRQGVLAIAPLAERPHANLREQALALLLVLPPGSKVCGVTAAVFWRALDVHPSPATVHIRLPPGIRHDALRGAQLHEGGAVPAVVVDDVPCTDLPQTLLDAAADLTLGRSVAMLDAAERMEPGVLSVCRSRLAERRPRGRGPIQAAVNLATGLPESVLESLTWVLCHTAGLPLPLMQAVIRRAGRFLARVDFLWPEAMLIVEVDGLSKYGEPGELQREKARQNLLVAEGYTVLRFTWADVVHRQDAVVRQIAAALMINSGSWPLSEAFATANFLS